MRKALSLVALLAAAACGTPLNVTLDATSPQPIEATLRCVSVLSDTLGYKPRMVNSGKGVEAQHKDTVLAPYEDGRYEKLYATGKNSKSNEGSSSLVVTASTFSQHWTRVGLESEEVPASEKVKKDAQTVISRCGGGQ